MSFFDTLNEEQIAFIKQQSIFFTATAPPKGRINLSPKGMDSFRVFNQSLAGYLDLTGSGNETAAHIHADGRFTIMMCSFTEKPLILRLYGKGEVVNRHSEMWEKYASHFPEMPGTRQIILIHIDMVQESCGYSIPFMELKDERYQLNEYWEEKGNDAVVEYQQNKNRESIDGLPTYLFKDTK